MSNPRPLPRALALAVLSLALGLACAGSAPSTPSSAPMAAQAPSAAFDRILILGAKAPTERFAELYGKAYKEQKRGSYEFVTAAELAAPTGTIVMLYDRSRPGYPSYYPATFPWLTDKAATTTALYGSKGASRVILLVSAANLDELMGIIADLPKGSLQPSRD